MPLIKIEGGKLVNPIGGMFYQVPWRVPELQKLMSEGIEFSRDEIQFKLLIQIEKENINKYIRYLLRINRKHTLNQIGIEPFTDNHWTFKEIKGILNTLHILGYGYHGRGIHMKRIRDWKRRFQKERTYRNIIDLDLLLYRCMDDVLREEGLSLEEYNEEVHRISIEKEERKETNLTKVKRRKKRREKERIEKKLKEIKRKQKEKEREKKLKEKKLKEKKLKEKKVRNKKEKKVNPLKKAAKIKLTAGKSTVKKATGDVKSNVLEYLKQKGN